MFLGPTGDIKVDGPLGHQVYHEELFEWCDYRDVREGRLTEDGVRGMHPRWQRRVPRRWLQPLANTGEDRRRGMR